MKNRPNELNSFVMPTTRKAAHELVEIHFDHLEGNKPFHSEICWLRGHWSAIVLGTSGCLMILASLKYPPTSIASMALLLYGVLMLILGFVMDIWRSIK